MGMTALGLTTMGTITTITRMAVGPGCWRG
jgi:hypothetical protein